MQENGWSERDVLRALRRHHESDLHFRGGDILGSMCTAPHELAVHAHALFLDTNLGDPGHFPGTATMEREVLDDLAALLHAPDGWGGRIVSGGTEANILACLMARERTGKREIVVSDAGHFSFEKAAKLLGMRLVKVPTKATGHADAQAMQAACGPDTALLIGIAGSTELGLVDSIAELSDAAVATGNLLHVDAAYGGYIIPFLEAASRTPRRFDFRLPGVWSIGLDPHKMGMATIPAGVLLMRDGKDWSRVAVESPYVSTETQSTLLGTRPGAPVAATWAVHRSLGRKGYASVVETCLDNTTYLAARLLAMGVELVAPPELNVVTFKSRKPRELQASLREMGYGVNVVPRLGAIRLVVGPHVSRPSLDRFLGALAAVVA